jgi:hypothetical protein
MHEPGLAADIRELRQRRLQSVTHLDHELAALPASIEPGERVVDGLAAATGLGSPGLLVVTSSRLLFLRFRHVLRWLTVRSIPFGKIRAVELVHAAGRFELRVSEAGRSTPLFPVA